MPFVRCKACDNGFASGIYLSLGGHIFCQSPFSARSVFSQSREEVKYPSGPNHASALPSSSSPIPFSWRS